MNKDPLLAWLRVDPLEPDAGGGLYPLHRLYNDSHLCLFKILEEHIKIQKKESLVILDINDKFECIFLLCHMIKSNLFEIS